MALRAVIIALLVVLVTADITAIPRTTHVLLPPPYVSRVAPKDPVTRAANVPGVTTFEVYGNNFGSYGDQISVSIGGFPCVPVMRVSSTQLECSVRGGRGANQVAIVTVNGVPSPALVGAGSGSGIAARVDFPNTASNGLSCVPPFGSADIFDNTRCNCWAGAASVDGEGNTDCNEHLACAAYTASSGIVSQCPPTRPLTHFANDILYINQTMPIVKGRRDTVIQFAIPNIPHPANGTVAAGTIGHETCFYPGTLWRKTINNLDCEDQYHAELHWTQHGLCGFIEDMDASLLPLHQRVFRSSLLTSFTETYKNRNGQMTYRTVVHTFMITVSFQIQLKEVSTAITVFIADENDTPSLTIEVSGDALYDVASHNTLITFQSDIVWPYQIASGSISGVWVKSSTETGTVTASAVPVTDYSDALCDFTQDSSCEQNWLLTIDTDPSNSGTDTCNIAGTYTFNTAQLLCRDLTDNHTAIACLGTPATTFVITVGTTDLCDQNSKVVDTAFGQTVVIDPFFDAAHEEPQTIFQTGDMIYLSVVVNTPLATIDRIIFHEISVSAVGGTFPTKLYDVDTAFNLTDASFLITKELTGTNAPVSPGNDAEIDFQFKLHRNLLAVLNTLSTTADLTQTLQITVTIDLYYHGNQNAKRTTYASALPAVGHAHISYYESTNDLAGDEDAEVATEGADADAIGNIWESSAASLPIIASVAGVAALALVL